MEEYSAWYLEYYASHLDEETLPFPIDPTGPRVMLVPGVGIVTSGSDAGRARVARDLYHRAIVVESAADALGGFRSLSEAEAFAIEYWPLERYKLAQAPPRRPARGPDRADHRRRKRDRPGLGARPCRTRRARGRRRSQLRRRGEVAEEIVAANGLRRRSPYTST